MYKDKLRIQYQCQQMEFNDEADADEKIVTDENNLYISYLKSKKRF